MYNICLSIVITLFAQSTCAADIQSTLHLSLLKKDIESTRSLLAAGAQPTPGMLAICKTRAQAELLVAHGINIENENKEYGFLPGKIRDGEPALLAYLLENIPLTVTNHYGEQAYSHLVSYLYLSSKGTLDVNDLSDFDKKLQILIDHNCYYNHDVVMKMIDLYSDANLDPNRAVIKKKFEQIAIKKQDNILLAIRKRELTGCCSSHYLQKLHNAIIHERRTNEIALHTKWKTQKLKEICSNRGVNLQEACLIFVNEHRLNR